MTTTSPNLTFPQGSEPKRSVPSLVSGPMMPSSQSLTAHDELWLLSGRWRAHARQLDRAVASAILKFSLISSENSESCPTTPGAPSLR